MIKELQDAYVSHDGATALRRKIRKFCAAQPMLAGGLAGECCEKPFLRKLGSGFICVNCKTPQTAHKTKCPA